MKKNVGNIDKVVRIILALVLAGLKLGGMVEGTWGILFLVLAVVFLFTALIGFCPLYALVGLSTCPKE